MRKLKTGRFDTRQELVDRVHFMYADTSFSHDRIALNCGISAGLVMSILKYERPILEKPVVGPKTATVERTKHWQLSVDELFYLQDSRDYVGNDILWWGLGCNGYTTNLLKAETFTKEEALAHNKSRWTDIPWPKEYVDGKIALTVDMQNVHIDAAKDQYKYQVQPCPKPEPQPARHCSCGQLYNIGVTSEENKAVKPLGRYDRKDNEKDGEK